MQYSGTLSAAAAGRGVEVSVAVGDVSVGDFLGLARQ